MFFQPIPHQPMLFIPELKIMLISDIHIGIENELKEYGVYTSSNVKKMESMIVEICKKYEAKKLIILGDVKHTIPSTSRYEKKDIIDFLESLQKNVPITIIPGNHDGGLGHIIPKKITLAPSDGIKQKSIGFIHGHRWPKKDLMKCDYLLCGHTHPTLRLIDRLGYQTFEPCWVKAKINKTESFKKYTELNPDLTILIFPAFNPLCGGISVNNQGIVGPLKHIIDLKNADIYLLDGSLLGPIKNFIQNTDVKT